MKTGEIIRNMRIENHLTQDQFAKKIGISRFSLIQYEKGSREVPKKVLKKISEIFNIELIEEDSPASLPKKGSSACEEKEIDYNKEMRMEVFKSFLEQSDFPITNFTSKELYELEEDFNTILDFEVFDMGFFDSKNK